MTRPVIISCAVTGGGDTAHLNPAVPVAPERIAAEVLAAREAGAAIAHIHVRDPATGKPSRDPALYRQVVERVRAAGSDVVLNLTTGPHLMAYLREDLEARGVIPLAELEKRRDGEVVEAAGAVIVRQRPGTAKGFTFFTVEDETGTVQAIIRPDLYRANRQLIVSSPILIIRGALQKRDGTLSIKARSFEALKAEVPMRSHDFH